MSSIIQKLRTDYPELFWENAIFNKEDVWVKLADNHLGLTLDFSLLCRQIRERIRVINAQKSEDLETLKTQLKDAIIIARVLEQLYDKKHLNVPRELKRIQSLRNTYSQILSPVKVKKTDLVEVLSLKQQLLSWLFNTFSVQAVRNLIFETNLYRLLSVRSRRFLEMIDLARLGSKNYGKVIATLNVYALPFFAWLAWLFFIPRATVNYFVLLKNTFYTVDMSEEQLALGYWLRFINQFKRRWFHLANDTLWFSVGLINCFLLVGPLLPISAYLTLAAFIFDVVLASINCAIELRRLTSLREQYEAMEQTPDRRRHLAAIDERLDFEIFRLSVHVLSTIAIALGASLALPFFASIPVIPLVGAIILVVISIVAFYINAEVEKFRPKDTVDEIELEPLQAKLGFFAQGKNAEPEISFSDSFAMLT